MNKIRDIRKEYSSGQLKETKISNNPVEQFQLWLSEAIEVDSIEPTAMTLATADKNGKPSARIVLLKDITDNGLTFYTNYNSRKGKELEENQNAALLFFWTRLERQIRIEGKVEKLSAEISDQYFNSRPLESRISAVISPQSKKISGREILTCEAEKLRENIKDIKRPDYWGGYILIPDTFEFWQGREGRLHDRISYERNNSEWQIFRLAP